MTIISLFVFGWWLVCSERKLLLAAVKPEEQGKYISLSFLSFVFSLFLPILFSISLYFSFSLSYPFNRLFPLLFFAPTNTVPTSSYCAPPTTQSHVLPIFLFDLLVAGRDA
jgi:hypothetical protein